MRVLIIGGTGLTGPHIVRELAEGGHDVTVFHRGRTVASLPTGVHEMLGDRAGLASHRDAFARLAPDVVLHMLAFTRADATLLVETFRGIAGRSVVIEQRGCRPGLRTFARYRAGRAAIRASVLRMQSSVRT